MYSGRADVKKRIRLVVSEADQMVSGTDIQPTRDQRCNRCGDTKTIEEFARDRWCRDGRRKICAACRAAYDHERYLRRTPGIAGYLHRCKRYGQNPVVTHFSREELVAHWGNWCTECGGSWSELDHIEPVRAGGAHSLTNCRPVCGPCNRRKYWKSDRECIAEFDRSNQSRHGSAS